MKRIVKLFFILVLVMNLTGCIKYNASMEIKSDKGVILEIIYGMKVSNDISDASTAESELKDEEESNDITTEDYRFLEELGYKVEGYEEELEDAVLSGVKISKNFKNIDEITSTEKITVDFNALFAEENVEKLRSAKFFYKNGDKYAADFIFDFLEGADEETRVEFESRDSIITDLIYKIKLPIATKEHNASSVSSDGKELTWNLVFSKLNKVNFTFALANESEKGVLAFSVDPENSERLVILGGIVLGLIFIGLVVAVVVILKKGKKENSVVEVQIQPSVDTSTQNGIEVQNVVVEQPQMVPGAQPVVEEQAVVEIKNVDEHNNNVQ